MFGYTHPQNAYVCDAEYAPATIFSSKNPKAPRNNASNTYFKFYDNEGWRFVQKEYPKYVVMNDMLQEKIIGVKHRDIFEVRKPEARLKELAGAKRKDELHTALKEVLTFICERANLSAEGFGVFGSMLHGFYHPKFSDIDLIIYGRKNLTKLCEELERLYKDDSSMIQNEFKTDESLSRKIWRFKNLSMDEYLWHQRRKLVYALYKGRTIGRAVKTEFEPVKEWHETKNEYDEHGRIKRKGWTKLVARVTGDEDAPFIPSVYSIEPLKILEGAKEALYADKIVSYMEEFRMQVRRDETVYAEGNLEEVTSANNSRHQIVLTYCPRYYEQVLKRMNHSGVY